jgi:hypothetical protein
MSGSEQVIDLFFRASFKVFFVMPDLIRHPEGLKTGWIPAFAGMTWLVELVTRIKTKFKIDQQPNSV